MKDNSNVEMFKVMHRCRDCNDIIAKWEAKKIEDPTTHMTRWLCAVCAKGEN